MSGCRRINCCARWDNSGIMPLPSDEKLIALSQDLIQQFDTIFGMHPGFRPAHAKGIMLRGTFQPSAAAASLTRAPHMNRESTPVSVRFSDGTGLPLIPDNDPNANPRGCAIRFHLAERVHTDIIAHSLNGFPVRNGQEFLEFLRALATSDPSKLSGSPLEGFLGSHPKALAFVQLPKPAPSSFARESFFGITAMRFTNQNGQSRYGRYRIVPQAGVDYLSDTAAAEKGASYLFDELAERIAQGPITLRVLVQLANDGDNVTDATEQWPEDRTLLDLGAIALSAVAPDNAHEQKWTIFDPVPRVDGIDPSDDPLLETRAALYLISGRRRRAAAEAETAKSGG
jgi:catalase